MKVETRTRKIDDAHLKLSVVLICENELESRAIDLILGNCGKGPIPIRGEVRLSDGYGEHYIEIEQGAANADTPR